MKYTMNAQNGTTIFIFVIAVIALVLGAMAYTEAHRSDENQKVGHLTFTDAGIKYTTAVGYFDISKVTAGAIDFGFQPPGPGLLFLNHLVRIRQLIS